MAKKKLYQDPKVIKRLKKVTEKLLKKDARPNAQSGRR